MKILMVCLGNICRSPLAEGILQSKIQNNCVVDSAGTIGFHEGEHPDKRSIATARKWGIDISQQQSRPITKKDLDHFDLILCMDKNNLQDVLSMATEEQKKKIRMIIPGKNVPDPYYGGIEDFEKVHKMLDEACDNIVEEYNLNHEV